MANVSAELLWPIVRDRSCFVVKRKISGRSQMGKAGVMMTTEPNNITSINNFKYSGLANAKTVGIDAAAEGGMVLTTKSRKTRRTHKVSCS